MSLRDVECRELGELARDLSNSSSKRPRTKRPSIPSGERNRSFFVSKPLGILLSPSERAECYPWQVGSLLCIAFGFRVKAALALSPGDHTKLAAAGGGAQKPHLKDLRRPAARGISDCKLVKPSLHTLLSLKHLRKTLTCSPIQSSTTETL